MLFSIMPIPIHLPLTWHRILFLFSISLPTLVLLLFLICISLISDVKHLSMYFGYSDQIRSVAQSCPILCDPMNRSTPGLPVPHQLPEFTQTHVHRVSDAIQPSHPLSSPSPPAPNPSQHQSLFQIYDLKIFSPIQQLPFQSVNGFLCC